MRTRAQDAPSATPSVQLLSALRFEKNRRRVSTNWTFETQLIFADGAKRWIIQAQERSRPRRGLEAEAARHPAQAQAVREEVRCKYVKR